MKKIILLFILIGISINSNLCAQNSYWSGSGADAKAGGKDVNIITYNTNPKKYKYEVLTEIGLAWISESVAIDGKNFARDTVILCNDLDLKEKLWTPIGNASTNFNGTFDGQNHLVSNMNITITGSSSNVYAGLFGITGNNSNLKNIKLEYFNITTNTSGGLIRETIIGGIAGKCSGSISNCMAIGSIYPSTSSIFATATVGLIAGSCSKTINGCYVKGLIQNKANIFKTINIGGICGGDHTLFSTNLQIINCVSDSIKLDEESYSRMAPEAKTYANNFAFAKEGSSIVGSHDNKHGESFTGTVIKEAATELTGNQDYVLYATNPTLSANFNGKLITTNGNIESLYIMGNVIQRGVLDVESLHIEGSFSQQGTFSSENLEITENAIIDGTYGINNKGKIVYKKDHQIFASKSKPDGWHSLCLPFDANICVDGTPIRPLSSVSGDSGDKGALHYWLKEFSGYTDSNVEFFHSANNTDEASTYDYIKNNKPYIYALPGPEWGRFNLVGKNVTFEGYGPIESFNSYTDDITYGPFDYTGSFINQMEKNNLYVLDESEGMFFYPKKESDTIKPYRAYFSSFQTQEVLKIANGSANDTSLEHTKDNNTLKTYASTGLLRIESDNYRILHIFDLQGRVIRQINVQPGVTVVEDLPKGIYIIDNKRIAI